MKKSNSQDSPAPKSAEQIRQRYNLDVIKNITSKQTDSGTAVGIGKKATIAKGLDVAGPIYSDNLNISGVNALPTGDMNDLAYMNSLKTGKYWYHSSIMTVANMPGTYGFVDIFNTSTADMGCYATFHQVGALGGKDYIKWCNSTTIHSWIRQVDENQIAPKILWTGSVIGLNTINVPGLSNYSHFIVYTNIVAAHVILIDGMFFGESAYMSGTTMVSVCASFGRSGDSLNGYSYLITHAPGTVHPGGYDLATQKIVGLS